MHWLDVGRPVLARSSASNVANSRMIKLEANRLHFDLVALAVLVVLHCGGLVWMMWLGLSEMCPVLHIPIYHYPKGQQLGWSRFRPRDGEESRSAVFLGDPSKKAKHSMIIRQRVATTGQFGSAHDDREQGEFENISRSQVRHTDPTALRS